MKNVLFYSPYMGYTGSEMMIKYIVSNAKKINPVILSGENGALLNEIPKNIPTYIHPDSVIWKYRLGRILKILKFHDLAQMQFKKIIKKHNIDLIVINTLVADKIVPLIKKINKPFALYVHELPMMYDLNGIKKDLLDYLINNSIEIIGCSEKVCESINLMGAKNVYKFYETIDINKIKHSKIDTVKIKSQLNNFSYIFIMSGQRAYHKGFHIIIEISKFLKKYNAALVWLGASNDYGLNFFIQKVIENNSIDNIILPGLLKDDEYYSWLNACDAFLLTSMVDPYPLVMLEAAYLQKTIIAFDSGGVTEFVKDGMGKIVPYYCVNAYLDAIRDFIDGKIPVDKELLRKEAEKHDITKRIEEFEDIILSFI